MVHSPMLAYHRVWQSLEVFWILEKQEIENTSILSEVLSVKVQSQRRETNLYLSGKLRNRSFLDV